MPIYLSVMVMVLSPTLFNSTHRAGTLEILQAGRQLQVILTEMVKPITPASEEPMRTYSSAMVMAHFPTLFSNTPHLGILEIHQAGRLLQVTLLGMVKLIMPV